MVFVGPSGCGKTTALRMVAGLEEITDGTLRIGDSRRQHARAAQRDVAMVFQNYALYPHMTVFDNIAFPLRAEARRSPRSGSASSETAAALGLTDAADSAAADSLRGTAPAGRDGSCPRSASRRSS